MLSRSGLDVMCFGSTVIFLIWGFKDESCFKYLFLEGSGYVGSGIVYLFVSVLF